MSMQQIFKHMTFIFAYKEITICVCVRVVCKKYGIKKRWGGGVAVVGKWGVDNYVWLYGDPFESGGV